MLNFLVETKNEYTIHLTNILTPLIFEGLSSIYKEAQVVSGTTDILKLFQSFLKRIPKWNHSMIEKETNRIINSSQSYGWLNDLIKATLKSTLIILMYNPTIKTQTKLTPSLYQDIKTEDFIHKVYIECARELWNNPYLMYHNYPPIEIKRNQRDTMNIIKECIKESLRKLLPVKHILQIYLGEEMEVNNIDNNEFEKIMSDVEERNLSKMIKKDLNETPPPKQIPIENQTSIILSEEEVNEVSSPPDHARNIKNNNSEEKSEESSFNDNYKLSSEIKQYNDTHLKLNPLPNSVKFDDNTVNTTQHMEGTQTLNTNSTKNPKDIGNKILNIINNKKSLIIKDKKTSDKKTSDKKTSDTKTSDKKTSDTKTSNTSPITEANDMHDTSSNIITQVNKNNDSMDNKIRQILKKDLASDSDLETSLNYSQEENDGKYREIFSNAIIPQPNIPPTQSKFFKKYLAL
jgi:hypothetical protein